MTDTPPAIPDEPTVMLIHHRSDMIAAIPTMLGFIPTDSAVIVGLRRSRIVAVARLNLAEVQHLTPGLAPHGFLAPATTAEIIMTGPPDHPGTATPTRTDSGTVSTDVPYAQEATQLAAALSSAGLQVTHTAWVPALTAGQHWRCHDHRCRCGGVLPDPRSTPLAALAAVAGYVTYPNRQALAETLRPDPEPVLRRRAELIAALSVRPTDRQARLQRVQAAIARADNGELPADDTDIAELAVALTDPRVRDASITHSLDRHARAAQRLWTALVRSTPAPHRAEPAVLLAITAYLNGEGALVSIATDTALQARPRHALAAVIQLALRAGLPPDDVRAAVAALPHAG